MTPGPRLLLLRDRRHGRWARVNAGKQQLVQHFSQLIRRHCCKPRGFPCQSSQHDFRLFLNKSFGRYLAGFVHHRNFHFHQPQHALGQPTLTKLHRHGGHRPHFSSDQDHLFDHVLFEKGGGGVVERCFRVFRGGLQFGFQRGRGGVHDAGRVAVVFGQPHDDPCVGIER